MTREEAIEVLLQHSEHWQRLLTENICAKEEGSQTIEALDMAIKALKQKPCDDAVSRRELLEPYRIMNDTDTLCVAVIRADIMRLPSVKPQ